MVQTITNYRNALDTKSVSSILNGLYKEQWSFRVRELFKSGAFGSSMLAFAFNFQLEIDWHTLYTWKGVQPGETCVGLAKSMGIDPRTFRRKLKVLVRHGLAYAISLWSRSGGKGAGYVRGLKMPEESVEDIFAAMSREALGDEIRLDEGRLPRVWELVRINKHHADMGNQRLHVPAPLLAPKAESEDETLEDANPFLSLEDEETSTQVDPVAVENVCIEDDPGGGQNDPPPRIKGSRTPIYQDQSFLENEFRQLALPLESHSLADQLEEAIQAGWVHQNGADRAAIEDATRQVLSVMKTPDDASIWMARKFSQVHRAALEGRRYATPENLLRYLVQDVGEYAYAPASMRSSLPRLPAILTLLGVWESQEVDPEALGDVQEHVELLSEEPTSVTLTRLERELRLHAEQLEEYRGQDLEHFLRIFGPDIIECAQQARRHGVDVPPAVSRYAENAKETP